MRRESELLQSLQQVRSEDVQVAQRKLEVAITKERYAATELNRNHITSPASGTVLEIHAYPGETVTSEGILELGDVRNMFVVAEVYISDVPRVRKGARASITGEGLRHIDREGGRNPAPGVREPAIPCRRSDRRR